MLAAALALALAPVQAGTPPDWLAAAVADRSRAEAYRALDEGRRPLELLAFAGLRPGMRVLDVGTGGGYYTEILASAVGPSGAVVGWNGPAFAARPDVQRALARIRARHPHTSYYATPTTQMALPAAAFDLVLLHLMYHDFYWESAEFGLARVEPRAVAAGLFEATKPGGTVVIVDHVAASGRDPRAEVDATHRIEPHVVRGDFEAVGFRLDAQSDLLRRPDDDHSKRVFDRSIRGKTDRFVFRFRKPEAAR